ncbi:hypothetical protein KJ854_01825 [Patescibacteria group bacterium]|nr:hypothetical protein [Patescibacteria group bacterium]
MIEEKTVKITICKAIELYDKGKWIAATHLLKDLLQEKISWKEKREIFMHLGWNYWKLGDKAEAIAFWDLALAAESDEITQASAHAGLGIYYAEKGDKEKALHHAKLAQNLPPQNATIHQSMNLNACAISLAKIGELDRAEEVLRKVMQINFQLEQSYSPVIAKKAKHQRAKNGYNLASLILIPQSRFYEALMELDEEVIPRYVAVEAETDLAAAYHRIAEVDEKMADGDSHYTVRQKVLSLALRAEERSSNLWRKHSDDPKRIETAEKNIQRIKEKIQKLEQ